MSKLSLDALKERAAGADQQELLNNVSGGTFGDCHCTHNIPSGQGPLGQTMENIAHGIHYLTCKPYRDSLNN